MPLITKAGFAPIPITAFATLDTVDEGGDALDISNDVSAQAVLPHFNRLALIRIPFPSSGDGRGFSLARRLRDLGYRGRLRAQGALISDQFRYALECGFDEVEIDDSRAARQPEAHWKEDQPIARNYRDRLAGRSS